MYSLHLTKWALALAVLASSGCVGATAAPPAAQPMQLAQVPQNAPPDVPPPLPAQEEPEVLTSGPVHEAFAEPVDLQAQPGLVAPAEPPANVQEVPPTERPVGDRYVWVPGYWSWDADRNGYIWVSACWRVAPPNMDWVPGYWSRVPGGFQWVPGFWAPTGGREIEYISAPPPAEDATPPGPPPSPEATWVPACSYWQQTQYVRRPGYWLTPHEGWAWVPSHYVWTPRGYVFCHGHWDYPLENRGVLFSPVAFSAAVYTRGGFSFSPSIVVDLGGIEASLFVYPHYSHYYFGDYYDDAYVRIGIFPRFESGHGCYDPLYSYDRWHYGRANPRWEEEQRHDFDRRRADKDLRPARTYREMETRVAKAPEPQRKNLRVAQPLAAVVANKAAPMKFQPMDAPARQKVVKQAAEVPKFREQRNQWEAPAGAPKAPAAPAPTAERRGPAAAPTPAPGPSGERAKPVAPPQRAEPLTPPAAQPPNGQRRETPPAVEPAAPAAPTAQPKPAEPKEPTAPPAAERKAPSAPPAAERKPAPAPAPAKAERIKTPPSPIVGRPAETGEKGPPPRPTGDRQDNPQDSPKDNRPDQGGRNKAN